MALRASQSTGTACAKPPAITREVVPCSVLPSDDYIGQASLPGWTKNTALGSSFPCGLESQHVVEAITGGGSHSSLYD